jgi:putative endonuclease
MPYFTYLAKCSDETLYCGYTNDIKKRLLEHNEGKYGSKYVRSRRPVQIVYFEEFKDKETAMKREHEIKKMTRKDKDLLINTNKNKKGQSRSDLVRP